MNNDFSLQSGWITALFYFQNKSGSALISPDRHKTNHAGNLDFWSDLAYDPRGEALELDADNFPTK
ncbi:hypothetical protein [Cytobacillus firmus]|uniref:hypothetical protein n=1 Tax=Cytobacillus firmus TaxID=1399 RepID=UPI00222833CC|nr:hypothetical protein [Cytobacillus firmus]